MKELRFDQEETRKLLEEEKVIAIPTETVYGLAIRYDSQEAYDDLCLVKRRPFDKAIAIMTDKSFITDDRFIISKGARRVIDSLLPGPLTVLLKERETLPYQSHLGTHIVGIRVPGEDSLLNFVKSLPFPIQVTSANISGKKALYTYEEVEDEFKDEDRIKGIVLGKCISDIPTTVVDLSKDKPMLIRQGEITMDRINELFYKGE